MMRIGLAVLMCLTTLAVASVSVWMVPLYLAFMALLFVTPRNQRQLPVLSHGSAKPLDHEEPNSDGKTSKASAGKAEILRCADHPVAETAVNELTVDATGSAPDPSGPGSVKQWRGRTRARKTGKSATEVTSVPPPVAWVRVGPGKFVRADSATHPIAQVQPHSQPDLFGARANPAADLCAPMPPGSVDTADAVAEQQNCNPLHSTESDPGDAVVSDEEVLGSATEEHGIAPFALSPAPTLSARSQARRVLRGFTSAIPGADQTCRRHTVGYGCKPRTSVWASIGANHLPQQTACRASGRAVRLHRALRPRSPPYLEVQLCSKDQHRIAVAEKSITATYGLSIGSPNQIETSERTD